MLSDNIRYFRKKNNMSQDELAEKLGVSRQSISLWENGQTQPTIDNIIALSKIFNISSDMLLGTAGMSSVPPSQPPKPSQPLKKRTSSQKSKTGLTVVVTVAAVAVIIILVLIASLAGGRSQDDATDTNADSTSDPVSDVVHNGKDSDKTDAGTQTDGITENGTNDTTAKETETESEKETDDTTDKETETEPEKETDDTTAKETESETEEETTTSPPETEAETDPPVVEPFDLFTYCMDFAINIANKKGTLEGDYCIYQQPSALYGGYEGEYFSISYWADSDMVEFCLHCPLSETQSHNFYLRMRGGYNGKYEYCSSKYYRDTGESLRSAYGYIDPYVFSSSYPISCDIYEGSTDGQNEFMEQTRVGMCDLIYCLKEFVKVEDMGIDFDEFEFANF